MKPNHALKQYLLLLEKLLLKLLVDQTTQVFFPPNNLAWNLLFFIFFEIKRKRNITTTPIGDCCFRLFHLFGQQWQWIQMAMSIRKYFHLFSNLLREYYTCLILLIMNYFYDFICVGGALAVMEGWCLLFRFFSFVYPFYFSEDQAIFTLDEYLNLVFLFIIFVFFILGQDNSLPPFPSLPCYNSSLNAYWMLQEPNLDCCSNLCAML